MTEATYHVSDEQAREADATSYHPSMLASGWFWGCGLIGASMWGVFFWVLFA